MCLPRFFTASSSCLPGVSPPHTLPPHGSSGRLRACFHALVGFPQHPAGQLPTALPHPVQQVPDAWFDSKQRLVRLEAARGSTRSSTCFDSKHNAAAMQSPCQHNPFLLPTHTFGRTKPVISYTHAAVRCRPIWSTHISLSVPCPPHGIFPFHAIMKKLG